MLGMTAAMRHEIPDEPWVPDDSTFGARLALIRQNLGAWNTKRAALTCGLNPQTWQNWERGGSVIHFDQQTAKIASALHVDIVWLRSGHRGGSTVPVTDREMTVEQPQLPGFRSHLFAVN